MSASKPEIPLEDRIIRAHQMIELRDRGHDISINEIRAELGLEPFGKEHDTEED